ncbi:YicC/YloC family endoribonuclease [Devosia sp. Leaf64]|uniref:YicC/YloC family endoribonuclease n=1 Tax=Devosia sp. Leaf64 TaxID=1736229 RepID=UPI000A792805|nr:YicC/YloC family endoribonuclease [Devosia sp. Leaf64]
MTSRLASMTGYARSEAAFGSTRLRVELKSVNGRGLDIRSRLAPGLDAFDIPLRQLLSQSLSRGSVNLAISFDRQGTSGAVSVNQAALETVLAAIDSLAHRVDAQRPTLDGILSLPGVLAVEESRGLDEEGLEPVLMAAVREAIAGLIKSRLDEGARIAQILVAQVDAIAALVDQADAHPARSRDVIAARLSQQVQSLRQEADISPERLAQEALVLATKADIQEEIDRLRAHIAGARALLATAGAVGRRLDFLAQEFNREANTLCSKSNAVELTAIGLDLKAAIDQLREQVQNIE